MKFSRSDFEMQRFESRRPNQPVRLKRVKYEGRSKTARYRGLENYGPPRFQGGVRAIRATLSRKGSTV